MPNQNIPDQNMEDHLRTLAIAGVSAVPLAGGPLAVFMEQYLPSSYKKRLNDFLFGIDEKLKGKLDISDLDRNEKFVTTIQRMARQAVQTHRREKIEALRNTVVSVALNPDIDEDILDILHLLLDRYAATHIIALAKSNRSGTCQAHSAGEAIASLYDLSKYKFWKEDNSLLAMVHAVRDLERDGLVEIKIREQARPFVEPNWDIHKLSDTNMVSIQISRTSVGSALLELIVEQDNMAE